MRAALFALAVAAGPAAASECRLALMLGMDVSTSVDAAEYALQRDGVVAALGAPEVRAALFGPGGHVALSVFEWSGIDHQEILLAWTELRSDEDLEAARREIAATARGFEDRTALGEALDFAGRYFGRTPEGCRAMTLDISGDGRSNTGRDPADIYAVRAIYERITVNALAVGGELEGVDLYYIEELLHGPGAFMEIADNYDDFAETMTRKLERELGSFVMGAVE